MSKKQIIEFQDGEDVTGIFVVTRFEARDYQRGRFLRLRLGDASGKVNAVMWDGVTAVEPWLKQGTPVRVTGRMGMYHNAAQITVSRLRQVVDLDELDTADFMPVSPYDRVDMAVSLVELIARVQDVHYRALMRTLVDEPPLFEMFCRQAAAKRWHHAFTGGLLEHTLTVLRLCERIVPFYRKADPSLLLCGALFHDVGKVEELSSSFAIEYTDEGRLLGHILLGELCVHRLAEKVPDMPKRKLDLVRHLILSHHGDAPHSPCKPQSLEANILHYVENMDAQLNAMTREVTLAREHQQDWSPFIPLLERYLYAGGNGGQADPLDSQAPPAEPG